jgi:hypothetical protein
MMDSAQHCRDQSEECRRLILLARSETEAHALKNISRNWLGLAGQIDRYNALMREQRRGGEGLSVENSREQGTAMRTHAPQREWK